MTKVAVQGCTVEISVPEGNSIVCTHEESGASTNVKAEGKPAYFGKLISTVNVSSLVLSSYPVLAGWEVTIPVPVLTINVGGTATYVLNSNNVAVLEGDEGSSSLAYIAVQASTETTVAGTIRVTAKITDAGQTSVTAS